MVLDDDTGTFKLTAPLIYQFARLNTLITIPEGFTTDFASIPALMQWLFPVNETYRREATLHDYLYTAKPVPRALCDEILACAMQEADVGKGEDNWWRATKRWMIWAGVRVGGGSHW